MEKILGYIKTEFGGHGKETLGQKMWQEKKVDKLNAVKDNPRRGALYGDVDIPLVLRTPKMNQLSIVERLQNEVDTAENMLEHLKEISIKKNSDMDIKIAELNQKMKTYNDIKKTFSDNVKTHEKILKDLKKKLEIELKK